ncbi:serine hydrolase domain-containing protein [Stenotrophobium rhamnosiphilum]|uniref:Serine hydrolase n=1 Tax=Stenotrophobium rhamnosiphilum TaxID=2029166 RepID=A0A2T5MGN5_9GAMM|nr:serine hydrolase domain-containing protein [Stenotrophobium rhamnosiphilum]PTU31689.1 serine hydrolase [Stenotrophobium rhamnosiphilum]
MINLKWFQFLKVKVPARLGGVIDVNEATERPAEDGDLSQKDVNEIWKAVEDLYRSGAYPGVSFCLRRRGVVLLDRSLGHASGNGPLESVRAEKHLLKTDTPICLFSASKAVTAILTHMLAEDGKIDLDAPVARYLPEFGVAGKGSTTVSQVLSHRGGFPTLDLPVGDLDPALLLDWDRMIKMICDAPPTPGRANRMSYHAITGGFILAEIIQRVTGESVKKFLDERLRKPLGMKYFQYGLEPQYRDHAALNYAAGTPVRYPISKILERALMAPIDKVIEVSNSDVFMDAVIPAGNIYATAEELSRFYQMLLDGGTWNGQQVMKPETVQRAVRPASGLSFDRTLNIPMIYSEGMMLGATPVGIYGPMTAGAYGHLGFMNILGWADPTRDISVGLLVTGKAVLGSHLIPFVKLMTTLGLRCR